MADPVLCDFEVDVLRECAGELAPRPWGAAVGACQETLVDNGLLTKAGTLTEAGTRYLAEHRSEIDSRR